MNAGQGLWRVLAQRPMGILVAKPVEGRPYSRPARVTESRRASPRVRLVARREAGDRAGIAFQASLAVADPAQGDLLFLYGAAMAREPARREAAEFPQPALALDIIPEAGDLWSAETGELLAALRMVWDTASEGGGPARG